MTNCCVLRNQESALITMHPGEYLRLTYLEPMGVTRSALAKKLNVSKAALSRMIAGKAALSAEMAVRLSHVLGRSPESWMAMQTSYSLQLARQNVDTSLLEPFVYSNQFGWTPKVPKEPGEYEWREGPGKPVHDFIVRQEPYGDQMDTVYTCYSLTDFGFIDREEGQWRRRALA